MWTCTNEEGDKFFYFKELGWIKAVDGSSVQFYPTGAIIVCPEDATHILIDPWSGFKVEILKHDYEKDLYGYWDGSRWMLKPDAPEVPLGYITKLNWCKNLAAHATPVNETESVPKDATHVQIYSGRVGYVKKTATDYCLQGEKGEWVSCGASVDGLSGTVVRLSDGYIAKRDCGPRIEQLPPNDWRTHDGHWAKPAELLNIVATVEVELRSGARCVSGSHLLNWRNDGGAQDVVKWRYA